MTMIMHELPDGSVVYSALNTSILAWLQASRTAADIENYLESLLSQGVTLAEAQKHVSLMLSKDREIINRAKDSRYTLALTTEWATALAEGGKTRQEALDLMARISVPSTVRWVETQPVPADSREYRFARIFDAAGAMKFDMAKAREIHKNKLRALRASKLAALDVEYLRADEKGDTTAKVAIANKKQKLRDVTADPRIAAATTLEELKAVMPEELL